MEKLGSNIYFNPSFKLLRESLEKENQDHVKRYFHMCHEYIHSETLNSGNNVSFQSSIFDLDIFDFAVLRTLKVKGDYEPHRTLVMTVFHMTRIEDICASLISKDGHQVLFTDGWLKKLNVTLFDTGNAWTQEEMDQFSSSVNIDALFKYRNAVCMRTRSIVDSLDTSEYHNSINTSRLHELLDNGSIQDRDKSKWLLDYWGSKDIAGIILMPLTRHSVVHLNECFNALKSYVKKHNV